MQLTCYLQPHRLNKTAFVRTNLTENVSLKNACIKVWLDINISVENHLKTTVKAPRFMTTCLTFFFSQVHN